MSTPLTDSINALTAYVNEVTGASDTTLSEAVNTLIEGFGQGGNMLWKSVTLEEDHTTVNVGNPIYWREFLGIPEQDILNGYIFFCEVLGNSSLPASYYMLHGFYYAYDNQIQTCFIRNNVNNGMCYYKNNYNLFATAGTTINVYRFKADDSEVKPDFMRLARCLSGFFYNQKNLPQKIILNPEELDSSSTNREVFVGAYEKGQNTATLDVTLILNQTSPFILQRFFWAANGVKKITITGNLNLCKDYTNMLQALNGVEEINAVFDFSSCPYPSNTVGVLNSSNGGNKVLQEMRFAPNTARVRLAITGFEALNDESLISVANCLVEGIEQSLALYSSRTARCSLIMGNNDNGTFVADENGTMTLADFITNVKGWTLE